MIGAKIADLEDDVLEHADRGLWRESGWDADGDGYGWAGYTDGGPHYVEWAGHADGWSGYAYEWAPHANGQTHERRESSPGAGARTRGYGCDDCPGAHLGGWRVG